MVKSVKLRVGAPMPKTLGACTDALKEVTKLRLEMDKECKEVKARETEINEHIIEKLPKGDGGAVGKRFKSIIVENEAYGADEWEDIWDWVVDNDRFDILGKSLNQKAMKELHEAGVKVPGTNRVRTKKLSITKV
jgi:hypothetical protein